ncbi:MAG: arsinothricin resistance N-acetyltransferase ArsN1 family B [Bdellovibrionota bacterium]
MGSPNPTIRLAKKSDAAAMLEIYRPAITDGPASFETEMPSLKEFEARVEETLKKFPWLVYELGGEVVGYAYAGTHRARAAYRWSVESSVYVSANHQKKGIGKALYQKLFQMLKDQGVVNVFGGITLPNPASVAIHEAFGFVHIGTFKEIGFKMGKWWDVGWWQLQLQRPAQPAEIRPYY